MLSSIIARSILTWIGLFVLAFVNGALREVLMKNLMGIQEPLAHQLSCLSGVFLWTTLVILVWKKLNIANLSQAMSIGALWFCATLLFETFVLNRNLTWTQIIETYNFMNGEFWGLVLLWIGLMPIVLFYFKTRSHT